MRARLPQPLRARGGHHPLRAVHRRARQHGDAGAVRPLPRRRSTWRARGPPTSRRSSAPPASSAPRRRASSAARRPWSPTTAARCRRRWTRWSSCPASAARPRTSCSATPSASPRASRSTPTCSACRTALGIAHGEDPIEVEQQLMALIPQERWTRTTDLLIFHGRKICDARRPRCGTCPVFALCRWEQRQAYAHPGAVSPSTPRPRSRPVLSRRVKR